MIDSPSFGMSLHLERRDADNNACIRCLFCWFGYLVFPPMFLVSESLVAPKPPPLLSATVMGKCKTSDQQILKQSKWTEYQN